MTKGRSRRPEDPKRAMDLFSWGSLTGLPSSPNGPTANEDSRIQEQPIGKRREGGKGKHDARRLRLLREWRCAVRQIGLDPCVISGLHAFGQGISALPATRSPLIE
jgi:hypothetical protein